MNKRNIFPIAYGSISAIIAYVAIFFICLRSFNLSTPISSLLAGIFAIFFFVVSWFRGHASIEIKRIVAKFHLTDLDLATITGMSASDFPIYNNHLQLILPKRYWPKVLNDLQEYEKEHSK